MKAVIFDMDGVISDTNFLQSRVEEELLRKCGINLPYKEITKKYAGMADKEFFEKMFKDFDTKCDVEATIKDKYRNLLQLGKGKIKPIEGVLELINKLKNNGFKLAVASASREDLIEFILSELKILDKFDTLTSSTEVQKGKPDPETFLLTAEKLKIKPKDCTVIEDGKLGMIAAKKGGMRCIGLVEDIKGNYPADKLVSSLNQLNLEDFK